MFTSLRFLSTLYLTRPTMIQTAKQMTIVTTTAMMTTMTIVTTTAMMTAVTTAMTMVAMTVAVPTKLTLVLF